MSLRRKILFKDAALLVSLLLMITGCLWGLLRQREHVRASLGEYAALQQVQAAQARLIAFQQSVHAGQMTQPQAIADLDAASLQMRQYKATVNQYQSVLPPEITPDLQAGVKTKSKEIVTELVHLTQRMDSAKPIDAAAVSAAVDQLSRQMAELLSVCNGFVHRTQLESDKDLYTAIIGVCAIAGCTLLIAVLASFFQYRWIMQPLHQLRQWCRRAAEGDFATFYQPTKDREFQELARDVNKMARELADFYHKLEAMVASKSRELVRSERLASVGYLAAGVAHEINNPLNIMSGYAELTLKRLRRISQNDTDAEVIQHLTIIRSEAFRCKEITQKLLSLAKGNGDVRETVSMSDAIMEVATMVRGVKSFRSRQLDVQLAVEDALAVTANLTEIKQVLLNLLINAIEAVPENTGRVVIEAHRAGDWIELNVIDNGRGMTPQTRERVFEPFFTNKRGAGDPGTGLGLSITYAIITHHGGEITAQSAGLNFGSKFIVRFPAASDAERIKTSPQARPAVAT